MLPDRFAFSALTAQNLSQYRWKNRLIILAADSFQHPMLQKQLSILQADAGGMEERKLLICQITLITNREYIKDIGNCVADVLKTVVGC